MRTKFEEFRLCEGDWKVHAFATVRYPDWLEDVRAQPSIVKRKAPEDEGIAKKKKKTKQDVNAPPPTDTNVIDLAIEEPWNPDPKMLARTSSPVCTPSQPHLSSVSAKSSAPTRVGTVQCRSLNVHHHPPKHAPSPTQLAPSPPQGSVPNPRNNTVPQHDSNTSLVLPQVQINKEPTSTLCSDHLSRRSPQPDDEQALPVPPVLDKIANIARAGDGADEGDLFAQLIIPPPLVQVPHTTDPTTTKPKRGKAMEPSKAITSQNLFAIDYLQEHPDTTKAKFKKVFDALDDTTKQKYDALAKQKKSEEVLAKKLARSDPK
ncbi:uncharacterized protein LACBIDRAFT_334098 [Laccaria bicolor S238N-H82]|uniref:Predicted protein n=1 Tax=Laccaria bicolor (strain S238N-H82 / ATCC MYA-4686) TaxID=486041 RepID=B0DY30_LACBS|nr:uncharacterized protein LACBIDRAFT_334098 [Laccaria bicolor S238N-H82]EDR00491.1 predicted protein [Laccaria bicolor S238N-H82]|eukprot:XP_001888883.1 predicted protein [Laccaria bicolor S238N-H82]